MIVVRAIISDAAAFVFDFAVPSQGPFVRRRSEVSKLVDETVRPTAQVSPHRREEGTTLFEKERRDEKVGVGGRGETEMEGKGNDGRGG